MKNKLVLNLYKNSRGAVIGDLYLGDRRLLATTHPATIAAAMFSMDEYSFVYKSEKGIGEFEFPVPTEEFEGLEGLLLDQKEADFMNGFITFSCFDFAQPASWDDYSDMHFRVATNHLPTELIKVAPSEPQPKSFKKALRTQNKYVYFPYC